jgi:hypothetical protein
MNKINENDRMNFFYDLKSKENMRLYYGFKGRFDYVIDDKSQKIKFIQDNIKEFIRKYDFVVYPESSSKFIEEIIEVFDIEKVKVKKRSIESAIKYFESLKLQKKERESHLEKLMSMNAVFQINKMKATQRNKYESVIFEDVNLPEGKGLLIDDSYFSGTTYRGLIAKTGEIDFLAIFAK